MESTTLNLNEKQDIAKLLKKAYDKHKSWDKVANVCSISETAVHMMANMKYHTKGDDAWLKVKAALDHAPDNSNGWQIVDTANKRTLIRLFNLAKEKSLWIPVAENGGAGKSTASKIYYSNDKSDSVYRIECRNWGKKEFLQKICSTLGINPFNAHYSVDGLVELATNTLKLRAKTKPQIIIDQANSLKPQALTVLIPIFNECEGFLSVIPIGTDNLEKVIKKGVKFKTDGFDELDSRLGRNYIHLNGYTLDDVVKICAANGVTASHVQKQIFEECDPTRKIIGENKTSVRFVTDCRRIRRCVEREVIKASMN
jgi:type II secretory pathway predicted ATPase ExeA